MQKTGTTDLIKWKNEECSASSCLSYDGNILWIDSTESGVPGTLCDANVVVGLITLHRLAKHVAELALTNDAK